MEIRLLKKVTVSVHLPLDNDTSFQSPPTLYRDKVTGIRKTAFIVAF